MICAAPGFEWLLALRSTEAQVTWGDFKMKSTKSAHHDIVEPTTLMCKQINETQLVNIFTWLRKTNLKPYPAVLLCSCLLLATPSLTLAHGSTSDDGDHTVHVVKTADGWQANATEDEDETVASNAAGLHVLNLHRINTSGVSKKVTTPFDVDVNGDGVKDIAVMPDNGKFIYPASPANPIDIVPGTRLR